MVKEMKLNLRQELSNQVFVITQIHIFFVTGDITATGGGANTSVVFKNCAPFTKCIIHINDQHIDTAESLDITM